MIFSSGISGSPSLRGNGSPSVDHYEFSLEDTSSESPSPETASPSKALFAPEIITRMHRRIKGLEPWMEVFQKDISFAEDSLSFAEPDKIVTTHLVWTIENVDFENKILTAIATYTYDNLREGNRRLRLDADRLYIKDVSVNGKLYGHDLKDTPGFFSIIIPSQKGKGEVSIRYQTHPEASGIIWIKPKYTEGKKYPLLYTLFQPMKGASAIPGQHTPSVCMTCEVNVKTGNPELMALSSVSNNPTKRNSIGIYKGLKNDRAFPLYLLSLHIGNFSHHSYTHETGIYAEKSILKIASERFQKLPSYMEAAKRICGEYKGGRYDPIVLGWAFPYMAMEHPCGSTCGAVAMEQIAAVVPHELAHCWTGNHSNWREFFLNAGWTTYIEYLICEKVDGPDSALMNLKFLLNETKTDIENFRDKNPELLKLCSLDPQREITRIPYGKGALFFFMLRNALGRASFYQFFRDYLKVFSGNTISEERLLAFLEEWLKMKTTTSYDDFMKDHHVLAWLQGTEIPPNKPKFTSKLMKKLDDQAQNVLSLQPIDAKLIKSWDIITQLTFLSMLESKISKEHLIALDAQLEYSNTQSLSLMGQWALLCAKGAYFTPATEALIVHYVIVRNSVYESKKIVNALCTSSEGRKLVQAILEEGKERLFPITFEEIKKIVETHG